jgi:hypothetical protein
MEWSVRSTTWASASINHVPSPVLKVNPEAGCAGGSGTSVAVKTGVASVGRLSSSPLGSTLAADLPHAAIVSDAAISSRGASCLNGLGVLITGISSFVNLIDKIDPF